METSRLGSKNKDEWSRFIIENNGLFLQSWEWGEFQKSLGRKIWRLGDCENWAAMVIKYDLPFGKNYLYCPAGPIINSKFKNQNAKLQVKIQKFLDDIKNIAEQEKSIFLKIEPFIEINIMENSSPAGELFSAHWTSLGFQKSDGGQRILKTLVLDLGKSEEELLTEMKQKTRYNIKVAEKHGIKTRVSESPEKDFEDFWRLMQETAKRNKIGIHSREYYQKQLLVKGDLELKLFTAEFDGKIIAADIVAFFGKKAIYLHGASDYEYRNLMTPYLLQWKQIKEAKKRGCKTYDFWGIDEQKWPGITRFKTGFGGKEIEYIGTYDYVFNKMWYWIYRLAKNSKL